MFYAFDEFFFLFFLLLFCCILIVDLDVGYFLRNIGNLIGDLNVFPYFLSYLHWYLIEINLLAVVSDIVGLYICD